MNDSTPIITPHLLITDDDRDFRTTLQNVFVERGFTTSVAGSGIEAIHIASTSEVHVALLDMHMPGLTGLEAAKELRTLKSDLPCVLISGGLNDEIMAAARREAVFSVLAKPVSFAEVSRIVCSALNAFYDWQPH